MFEDEWANILPINLEATYDWISIQQLSLIAEDYDATLPVQYYSDELDTYQYGILDMGGESIEIAYLTTTQTTTQTTSYYESIHSDLFNKDHLNLYVSGFEHLGHRDAYNNHLLNIILDPPSTDGKYYSPCLLSGSNTIVKYTNNTSTTVYGSGSASECVTQVNRLINKPGCAFDSCSIGGAFYPNNDVFISTIFSFTFLFSLRSFFFLFHIKNQLFVAFSNYAETAEFFNMEDQFELLELFENVTEYCQITQSQAKLLYPSIPSSTLSRYCFDGVYSYQILTYGYFSLLFSSFCRETQFSIYLKVRIQS